MSFELKNIKPCDAEQLEHLTKEFEQGGVVSMTPGDSTEKIEADAEGMMPLLLDESFVNEVCYVPADGKKTYHLSERAWGVMSANLDRFNEQIRKVSGGDIISALMGEGGGTETLEVPSEAYYSFADRTKITAMKDNPPPAIGANYDTDDWTAVGFNMPPEFVAALRAILDDKDNDLFRKGLIDRSYYITSDLESLEKVMNACNEIKVWLQNKMSEGTPEQKQFYRAQKQNILSLVNRFERFVYEQRQLAMEWRGHKWMLAVFGTPTALTLTSTALYLLKKLRNGKGGKPTGGSGSGSKATEPSGVVAAAAVALATVAVFFAAKTWGGRMASLARWLVTREAAAGAAWAAGVAVSLTAFTAYANELKEDIKDGKVRAGEAFVDYGMEFNDTFEDAFIEGFEFWNREIF